MKIQEADQSYIAGTYARFPVVITRGEGSLVWDEEGKRYLDLSGGIAVNTFGHSDAAWVQAVTDQLSLVQHTSNLYYTSPAARLAEALCARTGMKKVFFSNSGAEANECAIKAARRYAAEKRGKEYHTVITLKNSFHGRTLTTLAATGQDTFHQEFTPLTEGFVYANANDLESVKQLADEHKCAAVLIEVVQGEGGVNALNADFVQGVEALCRERDLLFMCDEVQVGNGRSGMLYGYMNYGVQPDVVTTAKGLGGGLPIGATLLGERVEGIFTPGSHGSTFGGNPVCCAGALNVVERLDEDCLAGVRERSEYIFKTLTGAEGIESVSGMGLMIGVKTVRPAGDVISDCMARGLLVIKAKDKVRLLPALNIPMEELREAINILLAVCAEQKEETV